MNDSHVSKRERPQLETYSTRNTLISALINSFLDPRSSRGLFL